MLTKRRSVIILITIIIAIVTFTIIYMNFNKKISYGEEFAYTYMNYGFSSKGIVLEPNTGNNSLGFAHFIDTKSNLNMPLSITPNSKNNDDTSFAYVLADSSKGYGNILIYNNSLYYTQTRSEFKDGSAKWYTDIYNATFSGDKIEKLTTFEGSALYDMFIQNGYLFVVLNKEVPGLIEEISMSARSYGILDLSSKSKMETPTNVGNNMVMIFLGVYEEDFYYILGMTNEESANKPWEEYILTYNLKSQSERPWCDDYQVIDGESYSYFRILKDKMIITELSEDYTKYTISTADLDYNGKTEVGSFYSYDFNFNPNIYGDIIFLSKYGEDSMQVLKNAYYDLVTNELVEVSGFEDYRIINRVEDCLLLENNQIDKLAIVSVGDYKTGNTTGLNLIEPVSIIP